MNEIKSKGILRTRLAVSVGFLGPLIEYLCFVFSEKGYLYYEIFVIAGMFLLCMLLFVGWFMLYPIIIFLSDIARFLFDRSNSIDKWHNATDNALWPLPWASTIGVVVWFIYSFGHFGGWPSDVIFGTIANLIGAWCYITIFRSWYLLIRQQKA